MKSIKSIYIIILFTYFLTVFSVKAIPLPLNFMLKPYIGAAYIYDGTVQGKSLASQNASIFDDLFKLENLSFHTGIKIHENFGIDYDYTKFARTLSEQKVDYTYNMQSLNLNLYYNFFDLIGTGFGVFGGVGAAKVEANNIKSDVTRVHAGLETTIFGIFRIFGSYEKYIDVDLATIKSDIEVFKIGLSMFFL